MTYKSLRTNDEQRITYERMINQLQVPFITSGRTKYRSPPPTVPLLSHIHPLLRKCVLTSAQHFGFHKPVRYCGNTPSEPLSSNGHLRSASLTAYFRRSGVMSHHYTQLAMQFEEKLLLLTVITHI
jgi:hypothetical protein